MWGGLDSHGGWLHPIRATRSYLRREELFNLVAQIDEPIAPVGGLFLVVKELLDSLGEARQMGASAGVVVARSFECLHDLGQTGLNIYDRSTVVPAFELFNPPVEPH